MSSLSAKARFARIGGNTGTVAVPGIGAGDTIGYVADATAARELSVADNNTLIGFSYNGPVVVEIRSHANVPLPLDAVIYMRVNYAGTQISVVINDVGPTFLDFSSVESIDAVGAVLVLRQVAIDVWSVEGDFQIPINGTSLMGRSDGSAGPARPIVSNNDLEVPISRPGVGLVFDRLIDSDVYHESIYDATTTRSAAVTDSGVLIRFDNAAATTYTINAYATTPLELGTILYALQENTGQVTFAPGAGVTFETPDSYKTRAQGSIIGMKHIALNIWQAFGDLEQVFPALSIPANATNASAAPTFLQAAVDAYALIRRGTALVFDAIAQGDITGLVAALAAKAPLASPALTGTPTAPTASPGTNTTQIATTAFVADAVSGLGGATIINGAQYVIDTGSTADSDPGNGLLKYNNATQASATFLYLDDLTDDGVTITAMWAALVAGGFVYIQSATDQDTWQIWALSSIVDAAGYAKFGVTLIADGGAFADGDLVLVTVQQGFASSGGGYSAGTSFPGSPATNDRFFRTDLGWHCYYDGTRWLTDFEIALPALNNSGAAGSGTASGIYWYHAIRTDYGLYITRWTATSFVAPTNDGTKYWTCRLESLTDAGVATSIATFNTSADTANRYTFHDQAINAVLSGSARVLGSTNNIKTSTPGNIILLPTVYARLIVT